jgi:hypothetical protein
MMDPKFIQVIVLILAAVFFMVKSSAYMLRKRNLLIFMPLFFLGVMYCFQAAFFFFVDFDLTISFQAMIAFTVYIFYIYLFAGAKK